jgi:hypothetical protein
MRRTVLFLIGVFALAAGVGIGMTPTPAEATDCGPCWLGCINGEEAICCHPIAQCHCKIIQGSECEF